MPFERLRGGLGMARPWLTHPHDRRRTAVIATSVVLAMIGATRCAGVMYAQDAMSRVAPRVTSAVARAGATPRVVGLPVSLTFPPLVPTRGPNGPSTDVYLFTRRDRQTRRIGVTTRGAAPSSGASWGPSVSGDGRLVAFTSNAELEPESVGRPLNGPRSSTVHVHDTHTGETRRIHLARHHGEGRAHSASLSADGRVVALVSNPADPGAKRGQLPDVVYLLDLETGTTVLVTRSSGGDAVDGPRARPALSADGTIVVFESSASNLMCDRSGAADGRDRNLLPDIYRLDRKTQEMRRVSAGPGGNDWWEPSLAPAVDGAGRTVAFSSRRAFDPGEDSTDFDLLVWRPRPAGTHAMRLGDGVRSIADGAAKMWTGAGKTAHWPLDAQAPAR